MRAFSLDLGLFTASKNMVEMRVALNTINSSYPNPDPNPSPSPDRLGKFSEYSMKKS